MSTAAPRTTAGLVGDLLAATPDQSQPSVTLTEKTGRDRAGVDRALQALTKAGALQCVPDAAGPATPGRRRSTYFMTLAQATAWTKDAGATVAAAARISLEVATVASKAAAATVKGAKDRQLVRLRFGVWSDGALAIEGLARTQLTLPADETRNLVGMLSSLPEGALQAMFESPLRPVFVLRVSERDYPLTAEQTGDLVAYIEQLPAKALRLPTLPGFKAGTDHRVHRLEVPEDREDRS